MPDYNPFAMPSAFQMPNINLNPFDDEQMKKILEQQQQQPIPQAAQAQMMFPPSPQQAQLPPMPQPGNLPAPPFPQGYGSTLAPPSWQAQGPMPQEVQQMQIQGPQTSYTANYGPQGLRSFQIDGGQNTPVGTDPMQQIKQALDSQANQRSMQQGQRESGIMNVPSMDQLLNQRYGVAGGGMMLPQYMRDQALSDQMGMAKLQAEMQMTQMKENAAKELAMAQLNQQSQQGELNRQNQKEIAGMQYDPSRQAFEPTYQYHLKRTGDPAAAARLTAEDMAKQNIKPTQQPGQVPGGGPAISNPATQAQNILDLMMGVNPETGNVQLKSGSDIDKAILALRTGKVPQEIKQSIADRLMSGAGGLNPADAENAIAKRLAFNTIAGSGGAQGGNIGFSSQGAGGPWDLGMLGTDSSKLGNAARVWTNTPFFNYMNLPSGRRIDLTAEDLPGRLGVVTNKEGTRNEYNQNAQALLELLKLMQPKRQ